jgi:hypothetical protein
MDRTQPFVTKLQEGFIGRLVGSLRESYSSSGLTPGIMVDQVIEEDEVQGSIICRSFYTKRNFKYSVYF